MTPTPEQLKQILHLAEAKNLPDDRVELIRNMAPSLDEARANRWIGRLLRIKNRPVSVRYLDDGTPVVTVDGVLVPAGRYGVLTPHYQNKTSFFTLWIGDKGDSRWHEKMSMRALIGDDEQRLHPGQRQTVLQMIAEQGPHTCLTRYGLEIGKCGVCGRTLTNDESRARGIGPVCAEKYEALQ